MIRLNKETVMAEKSREELIEALEKIKGALETMVDDINNPDWSVMLSEEPDSVIDYLDFFWKTVNKALE